MKTRTEGATIYQFPKGGRAGLAGDARNAASAARKPFTKPLAWAACGSGAYHEAAIREAAAREN